MRSTFLPIATAVMGGVLYHVAQKSIPKAVSPFAAIIVAYTVGIALCGVAFYLDPARPSFLSSVRESNWAVVFVGVGAAIIEVSVLLAYRGGWNINTMSVVMSISVALILIPVGLFSFNEHLSLRSAVGIACCLIGLWLISKR